MNVALETVEVAARTGRRPGPAVADEHAGAETIGHEVVGRALERDLPAAGRERWSVETAAVRVRTRAVRGDARSFGHGARAVVHEDLGAVPGDGPERALVEHALWRRLGGEPGSIAHEGDEATIGGDGRTDAPDRELRADGTLRAVAGDAHAFGRPRSAVAHEDVARVVRVARDHVAGEARERHEPPVR